MGRNHTSPAAPPMQQPVINLISPEETATQADSFVVRIWRQAGTLDPQCRGWIEHVQSGKRTPFLGLDCLPSVIAACIGIPIRQGMGWRDRLRCWHARITHRAEHTKQGSGDSYGKQTEIE